jgi:hypothetical protein
MRPLEAQERQLTGLARGTRAARSWLPPLLALALLVTEQPEMAGFGVFGTFAHLVMVNYHPAKGARSAESGTLTAMGAILVVLGTLASPNIWLAVPGAAIAGFQFASREEAGRTGADNQNVLPLGGHPRHCPILPAGPNTALLH